ANSLSRRSRVMASCNSICRCSLRNDFSNAVAIKIISTMNGKAASMEIICNASSPPLSNSTPATDTCTMPQVNRDQRFGLSTPLLVNIPNTKVAELAEVITNNTISTNIKPPRMAVPGRYSSVANSAELISVTTASPRAAPSNSSKYSAEPPKVENQTILNKTGMPITPNTNSRMVRPREIRAIKLPTNGAHDNPQAQ